jgi:chemotaxis protein MotC
MMDAVAAENTAEATEAFGPPVQPADADSDAPETMAPESGAAPEVMADAAPVPASAPAETVAAAAEPVEDSETALSQPEAPPAPAPVAPTESPKPEPALNATPEPSEPAGQPVPGIAAGSLANDTMPPVAADVADASNAAAGPPAEPVMQPFELVRALQTLQDQMAIGSTEAFAAQRAMLARIDEELVAADAGVWQDKRNAEALVTYVLSGGNPAILRQLLGEEPVPAADPKLMQAALAYTEGRAQDAKEKLAAIDPLHLPAGMASQVALAKAALNVGTDSGKAIQQLDIARLLAPGTLAEEAAIRREILVVAEHNDLAKLERLARQYFSRFRHSVYAGNFRERFSAALTRMDFVKDEAQFGRLDAMLGDLDPDTRLEIYLLVARAAVTEGKTRGALLAAERALGLAKPGSVEQARARLYRAAASAVSPQGFDAAIADLDEIEAAALPAADRALAEAAARTADAIRGATDHSALAAKPAPAPAAASPRVAPAPPEAAPTKAAGENDALPPITRAEQALAAVDALLEDRK